MGRARRESSGGDHIPCQTQGGEEMRNGASTKGEYEGDPRVGLSHSIGEG